jgi:hypothetical protein
MLVETKQHARLKRDRRSAVVILSAIAAMLTAVVIWLLLLSDKSPAGTRGQPVYWMLMVPLAFWAIQLASYTPWTLRRLRVAQTAAPILAGLGVGAAAWTGSPALTVTAVGLGVCLAATFTGVLALRGTSVTFCFCGHGLVEQTDRRDRRAHAANPFPRSRRRGTSGRHATDLMLTAKRREELKRSALVTFV